MEYAIWKGIRLSAHEVSKSVEKDTEVRLVSSKELFCPDPECKNPILRYCNGEIKRPYFAHICNTHCDYGEYDKMNSTEVKDACRMLFEHLVSLGYDVQMEAKILKHHYTHVFIKTKQDERFAIELGDKTTKTKYINRINKEYKNNGISVRWILVATGNFCDLTEYSFKKSLKKDLIIIDPKTKSIEQYKIDETKYIIAGEEVYSKNYPKIYKKTGVIGDLVVEDKEITIRGFYKDYDEWHAIKIKKFEEKKEKEEKRITKERIEGEKKWQEEQNKRRQETIILPSTPSYKQYKKSIRPSYEERKQEIVNKMNQMTEPVCDSLGIRWIKCEKCGKIDEASRFLDYGGVNRATRGECRDCCCKIKNKI